MEMKHFSRIFGALANPVRLKILSIVSETKRPLHIKAVAEALSMDYAAVYRHVDLLEKAGLLQVYEVGRSRVLSPLHADLMKQVFSLIEQMKP
jgi:DNA-binding transcriptional ArsR family regulator